MVDYKNNNNNNNQLDNIDPYILVDEKSSDEIYVGVSITFNDKSKNIWKIKRIIKLGNIWHVQYPNGNRDYIYCWNDRLSYIYD